MLLCAPNMGIVDNWLPVLEALKKANPHIDITAFVPKRSGVYGADPDDTVIVMIDELIDEVIFGQKRGGYLRARCFRGASWSTSLNRVLGRAADRVQLHALRGRSQARTAALRRLLVLAHRVSDSRWIHKFKRFLDRATGRSTPTDLVHLTVSTKILVYDVYTEHEPTAGLLDALVDVPKLSLHHGVDIVTESGPRRERDPDSGPVTVYLFSEREMAGYKHRFGVPADDCRVAGIPRHDPAWIERVTAESAKRHDVPWDGFVFLVSRPRNTTYLPADRRRQAIEDLRDVAMGEFGLRIVVKLHPKEAHQGIFEEVFGLERYGRQWIYSRAHPMHIASRAGLAFCFLSGVAVDMIACGVPVVERLDLRGLAAYDRPGAVRDRSGRPVLQYRQHGLVLGADDRDDLRGHLQRIVDDRAGALADLQRAYRGVFGAPGGASQLIVDDAERLLEMSPGA